MALPPHIPNPTEADLQQIRVSVIGLHVKKLRKHREQGSFLKSSHMAVLSIHSHHTHVGAHSPLSLSFSLSP